MLSSVVQGKRMSNGLNVLIPQDLVTNPLVFCYSHTNILQQGDYSSLSGNSSRTVVPSVSEL